MTDLLKLAERCEQATGPDREIDHDIRSAINLSKAYANTPDYTASLDAAMTLVPEGWERIQQEQVRMSDGTIRCWATIEGWTASPKRCATPALALCAAAFRARAAS